MRIEWFETESDRKSFTNSLVGRQMARLYAIVRTEARVRKRKEGSDDGVGVRQPQQGGGEVVGDGGLRRRRRWKNDSHHQANQETDEEQNNEQNNEQEEVLVVERPASQQSIAVWMGECGLMCE